MMDTLQKHFSDIATWNVPNGGFYVWLRLHASLSIRNLFEKALQEGILLNPGNVYDPNPSPYLRLSYSYASRAELEQGLQRLSSIIRQLA